MTTFNTGNPIGSTDARDLSDNAENFDVALGTLSQTWVDRLGNTRDSFEGRLAKGSFYRVGTFATGYTLTNMRQTLLWEVSQGGDGNEYGWTGDFPKTVTAGLDPSITAGFIRRSDAVLREDLLKINGAHLVQNAAFYIEDVLTADVTNIPNNAIVVARTRDGAVNGGGVFYYLSASTAAHDGGVTFTPQIGGGRLIRLIDDRVSPEWFGAKGDNSVDDCVGWIAAVAWLKSNGGGSLFTESKAFYFKTYQALATYIPAIVWQNDPCVIFDGVNNINFECGSAKIYVLDAAADAHPNTSGHCVFGFNNCVNIRGDLPEIVGNRGNLPAGKFNAGVFFESCINVNLSVLKFSGNFDGGSNIAGGHIYDVTIGKIISENTSIVVDTTCIENFTVGEIVTSNPATLFSSVFEVFYDGPSFAYNVSGRALKKGMSSNVRVGNIVAHGANSAVFLDCIDGFEAHISQVGGQRSAVITTSAGTNSLGKVTKNIRVSGDIEGLTDSAGVFTLTSYGVKNIKFDNFNVKNCTGYGVAATALVGLDTIQVTNSDWSEQTLKIDPTLAGIIGASGGLISNVKGYTPRLNAVNTALPSAVGSANKVTNNWPFPVQVIINTTGANYVTHILEPDLTDINLGVQTVSAPLTLTLNTGESVYFEGNLPTYWYWRGL